MHSDERELGALMVLAQAGDAASYRVLLEHARDWLERYYQMRLPATAVEDAVQDALTTIHMKRASFDASRPFGPWMAGIARFLWIDRLRRTGRQAEGAAPGAEVAILPRPALDAAADVARLMARLKPAQADAIRLVKLQGYSVEDAALLTGQSASLVKINIHRGIARLMKLVSAAP